MTGKTALIAAVALLIAGSVHAQYRTGYSDLDDSETVSALKEHIATISSAMMEGRKAGSEGERLTAEYITGAFKSYGIDVVSPEGGDPFGIRLDNGDTLVSRNVCAFIHGGDKTLRDNYIVIGARMDNLGVGSMTVDGERVEKIYYGANGNASGVAMMLELARMLRTNKALLRRSVLFVAFGASRQSFAGSWYFLNRSFSDVSNIDAMINLDMLGTGSDGFYAYTASNADMNAIARTLSDELQPIRPSVTAQEPYPSDHIAFYDKKIPSVFFTSGRYPAHDTERDTQSIIDYQTMELELEYIFNYTIALANGPKPVFDPSDVVKLTGGVSGVVPYYDCDVKPSFLGSDDPRLFLQKWVYSYMKYPEEAVKKGVQGRVLVDFVISEDGKIRDVKVLKGADPLLDEEAVRIISASPQWKPGRVRGKKVSSEMSLYVEFRLEKKGTRSFGLKKN
ncbi:MAG: TonB family protein [Bacteroidales bacterium]|nr:TonB family protein [Bacteroidales bacterium]